MDPRHNASSSEDLEIEALLAQAQAAERERVDAELQEIEQALTSRDDLHDSIIEGLEAKLGWYVDRLAQLYRRNLGNHGERDRLRTRIDGFYDDIRTELRAHWRDRQDLLTDRRDLRHELNALDDGVIEQLLIQADG